jgi:hypothetical protein
MYIVLSSNQKYDYHINRRWSLKIFKMGPNAERLVKILDVIVYLFVDTCVPIMYRVMSSPTKSTTLALTDIGFQKKNLSKWKSQVSPKKVRPSHLLSKWNRTPKGSSIFGNVRAYLFVGTIVTILYRVVSSLTESTTLAFIDIGSLQNFQKKMEPHAERLVGF